MTRWQTLRLWLAVPLVLILALSGLYGLQTEWGAAGGLLQHISALLQTAYALGGLVVAALLIWRIRAARPALYTWAVLVILTHASAPLIWGGTGLWPALFAGSAMVVLVGIVIWIAPLPPLAAGSHRWRWGVVLLFLVASAVVAPGLLRGLLAFTQQWGPKAMDWKQMESFCTETAPGMSAPKLMTLAQEQGYVAKTGVDAKGQHLIVITTGDPQELYRCEVKLDQDGVITSVNFNVTPQD